MISKKAIVVGLLVAGLSSTAFAQMSQPSGMSGSKMQSGMSGGDMRSGMSDGGMRKTKHMKTMKKHMKKKKMMHSSSGM